MVKYSLIVPAYNEEKYIANCLKSLKNQSYKDFEIIVINNNSTDKTKEIARRYTKRIYDEKKKGYIYAMNKGAKKAKGKYMCECAADTIYPRNWLKKVDHEFKKDNSLAGVYGSFNIYDANWVINFLSGFCYDLFNYIAILLGMRFTVGSNFVYRRDLFLKLNGFSKDNKHSPDLRLGKRLMKYGKIKYNRNIRASTSFRRIKKIGIIPSAYLFIKLYMSLIFNKNSKITQEEYESYRI